MRAAGSDEGGVMEARLTFDVGSQDTAAAVGSGSLPVLGTPRLLAWCEAATCAAIDPSLAPGSTSVGVRVELDHLAASAVGRVVHVVARLDQVDGRTHTFAVQANHDDGELVATGRVVRVVVVAERFVSRLSRP